ncbi:MAG: hypothetical protein ACREBW_05115 [Candidatus Micrarchaeaceae archaeon]
MALALRAYRDHFSVTGPIGGRSGDAKMTKRKVEAIKRKAARQAIERAVADLFHAEGHGMPWLLHVLQGGFYRSLSEIPLPELEAALRA